MDPLELTDAELVQIFERETAARGSAVPLDRLAQVNAVARTMQFNALLTGFFAESASA